MTFHFPRKRFGQHFLRDASVIAQLLQALSLAPDQCWVEIGPGEGILTEHILPRVKKLDVIEIDRDLVRQLREKFESVSHLTIHEADVLTVDFNQFGHFSLVGNLPYNISTPILFHLTPFFSNIDQLFFMLQKEVVDRLVALPGTKDYGRLSVMMQYHCEMTHLFDVPPGAFNPPPKVWSSVVKLNPYRVLPHPAKHYSRFENIVREAFTKRRKTIRNALKSYFTIDDFKKAGVDSTLRPEVLTVADYVRLSNLES